MKKLSSWLERFLRTDIHYLWSGGFWLTTSKVFIGFLSFITSLFYARYIPREVFGHYRYVVSIFGILGVMALPGIGVSITRSVARGFHNAFRQGFWTIFFSSWLTAICLMSVAGFFFFKQNITFAIIFASTAWMNALLEGTGSWVAYLDGIKEFKKKAFFLILRRTASLLVIIVGIVGIVLFRPSTTISVIILVASVTLSQAIMNLLFTKNIFQGLPRNTLEKTDPQLFPYGIHITLASIPSSIASYLDSILLYTFLGPLQLAVYSFAILPIDQLKSFLMSGISLAMPKFSTQGFSDLQKNLPLKIMRLLLLSSIFIGAYVLFAPLAFKIFFPKYTESIIFSQVLALSLLLFPFSLFGTAIEATGSLKRIYAHKTAGPLVQITLFIILIPSLGIWGAVIGRLLGRSFNLCIMYFLFKRVSKAY